MLLTARSDVGIEGWNATAVRIEYEGARYHLLSRGDRCEDIVFDDADRKRFVGGETPSGNPDDSALDRRRLANGLVALCFPPALPAEKNIIIRSDSDFD